MLTGNGATSGSRSGANQIAQVPMNSSVISLALPGSDAEGAIVLHGSLESYGRLLTPDGLG